MRLLNIGCGSVRPQDPRWTNLDNLRSQLKPGTPERANLDREPNYVDHDLCDLNGFIQDLPFPSSYFDGILCSHVIEHFDCQQSFRLLAECRRVLEVCGALVVSVPDVDYFLSVLDKDIPENAVKLFGEPICPDEPWHKSFFDYALFYKQHKQILSHSALKAILIRAGFSHVSSVGANCDAYKEIEKIMNRRKFSLEMCVMKESS